jgi:tRNA (guanosine-2'-O-)-methyltransferase
MTKELIQHLSTFVTPQRFSLFQNVVEDRTRYISVLLEDIFQPHNASAVLRSCDCFGIQDVHIVENENEYTINPDVALGASNWLNLYRYNDQAGNTLNAITALKEKGYRIIATTPHTDDINLEDFDLSKGKFVLMFGSELPGLSETALQHADEYLKIPMYGFTESFNISVSAAIILHHLTNKLRHSDIEYLLNEQQKDELILSWLKQSVKKSELIIKDFLSNKS